MSDSFRLLACTKINEKVKSRMIRQFVKLSLLSIFCMAILSACSTSSILSGDIFDGKARELPRTPVGSVSYICDNNAQFYVRMLNNGSDAWVIYPDHEVNLPKQADGRFTNGTAVFTPAADGATLTDGEKVNYTTCKAQVNPAK